MKIEYKTQGGSCITPCPPYRRGKGCEELKVGSWRCIECEHHKGKTSWAGGGEVECSAMDEQRKKEIEELNKKLKVTPPCPHYEPLNYMVGAACYNCIHCHNRICTITGEVQASYEEMC